MGFRDWLARRRKERAVRRHLDEAFSDPECLRGTSLRPVHASRYVVLSHESDGDDVLSVEFAIERHPRPYAFSPQHHKVAEFYRYLVAERKFERLKGINLTRQAGRDSD